MGNFLRQRTVDSVHQEFSNNATFVSRLQIYLSVKLKNLIKNYPEYIWRVGTVIWTTIQ